MTIAERLLDEFDKYTGTEIGTVRQAADLLAAAGLGLVKTDEETWLIQGPAMKAVVRLTSRRNVYRAARRLGVTAHVPDGEWFVRFHDLAAACMASVMGKDPTAGAPVHSYWEAHMTRKALLMKQVAAERKQ